MKDDFLRAIGRAFSHCCEKRDLSSENLLSRIAWELSHDLKSDFDAIAILLKNSTGAYTIGKPKETITPPLEILQGFLLEQEREPLSCRVRDHALDSLRFLGRQLRTSVTLRLQHCNILESGGEGIIWLGLSGVATPKKIERAQKLVRVCSDWLEVYGASIRSIRKSIEEIASLQNVRREMTTIAHDVRAPLSTLQYLVTDMTADDPTHRAEREHIAQELRYVDRLLEGLSPRRRIRDGFVEGNSTDICSVLASVIERCKPEASLRHVTIDSRVPRGFPCRVLIPELDAERVLSNLLGNAVRYGGKAVRIEVQSQKASWCHIEIVDEGPGFPADVIEKVSLGVEAPVRSNQSGGWGIGLVSSARLVRSHGGTLTVENTPLGARVLVSLPQMTEQDTVTRRESKSGVTNAGLKESVETLHVGPKERLRVIEGKSKESEACAGEVIVVDDDGEHAASLERVLVKNGARVRIFTTVTGALECLQTLEDAENIRVLCDVHMPDGGADRLLRRVQESGSQYRCAVMSGEAPDEELYQFAALGAREFFSKPIDMQELLAWLQ